MSTIGTIAIEEKKYPDKRPEEGRGKMAQLLKVLVVQA